MGFRHMQDKHLLSELELRNQKDMDDLVAAVRARNPNPLPSLDENIALAGPESKYRLTLWEAALFMLWLTALAASAMAAVAYFSLQRPW